MGIERTRHRCRIGGEADDLVLALARDQIGNTDPRHPGARLLGLRPGGNAAARTAIVNAHAQLRLIIRRGAIFHRFAAVHNRQSGGFWRASPDPPKPLRTRNNWSLRIMTEEIRIKRMPGLLGGARFAAPLLALGLLAAACSHPPEPPPPAADSGIPTARQATGSRFMVATADPAASAAALDMLRRGGSAVDAAVAAQLVLGLVEPQSSGIGGGAFLLHWDGVTHKLSALDGRETAPKSARGDLFLDQDGKPLDFMAAARSGRSIGVPGLLRVLEIAHRREGRLPWADLFQPAIDLAESGFAVPPQLAAALADEPGLKDDPDARAYFYDAAGNPRAAGAILRNPDYAATLRAVAGARRRCLLWRADRAGDPRRGERGWHGAHECDGSDRIPRPRARCAMRTLSRLRSVQHGTADLRRDRAAADSRHPAELRPGADESDQRATLSFDRRCQPPRLRRSRPLCRRFRFRARADHRVARSRLSESARRPDPQRPHHRRSAAGQARRSADRRAGERTAVRADLDVSSGDRRQRRRHRQHDQQHRDGVRLASHGERLPAQQPADRLLLPAGLGRATGRQPGRARQAAAQLHDARHRARARTASR